MPDLRSFFNSPFKTKIMKMAFIMWSCFPKSILSTRCYVFGLLLFSLMLFRFCFYIISRALERWNVYRWVLNAIVPSAPAAAVVVVIVECYVWVWICVHSLRLICRIRIVEMRRQVMLNNIRFFFGFFFLWVDSRYLDRNIFSSKLTNDALSFVWILNFKHMSAIQPSLRSKCRSLIRNCRLHLINKHSRRLNSTRITHFIAILWNVIQNYAFIMFCVFCLRFAVIIMTPVLDHLPICLVACHAFSASKISFSIIFVHLFVHSIIIHIIVHWISLFEVFFYDCSRSYIFDIIKKKKNPMNTSITKQDAELFITKVGIQILFNQSIMQPLIWRALGFKSVEMHKYYRRLGCLNSIPHICIKCSI